MAFSLGSGLPDGFLPDRNPITLGGREKTMTRQDDFVIIMGSKAKTNIGKPIANMSLFALHNGQAKPILPRSTKESNGDWVLTTAPSSIKGLKPETDEDNGRLDANDQVACMIKDSGDRMDKNLYPQGALAVDGITLTDPLTGQGLGISVLLRLKRSPNVSYIKYNTAKDQVETSEYIMGFPAKMPIAPGFISISGSPNLIDRMKIRVVAHILGIPVHHINENQFVSSFRCTRPVRSGSSAAPKTPSRYSRSSRPHRRRWKTYITVILHPSRSV